MRLGLLNLNGGSRVVIQTDRGLAACPLARIPAHLVAILTDARMRRDTQRAASAAPLVDLASAAFHDMLFPVAELVAKASIAMTLEPGDLIVTGTPAGVGVARKPSLFMKHGDVCEVSVEGIGVLRNPIRVETSRS